MCILDHCLVIVFIHLFPFNVIFIVLKLHPKNIIFIVKNYDLHLKLLFK